MCGTVFIFILTHFFVDFIKSSQITICLSPLQSVQFMTTSVLRTSDKEKGKIWNKHQLEQQRRDPSPQADGQEIDVACTEQTSKTAAYTNYEDTISDMFVSSFQQVHACMLYKLPPCSHI